MPPRSDPRYLAANGFKRCKKCERVSPVEQFYKKKGSADGFAHRCKECVSDRGRELYETSRDRQIAYAREWYGQNRQRARAAHSAWYERKGRELVRQRRQSMTAEERALYNEQQRAARAADPERFRLYDRKRHLQRLGVTLEEYDALLAEQGGACAICQGPPNGKDDVYVIDHDHGTDELRGLLCSRCNRGLGFFGDNAESLRRAIAYLAETPFQRFGRKAAG